MMGMNMPLAKEEAMSLIQALPDDCSLEDIMYELYVKNKINAGLKAVKDGKTLSHEKVKKRFS